MTAAHAAQIIDGYLARLDSALADAPPDQRQELIDDVRAHIDAARSSLDSESDADLLNILDRLGSPEEIADEERERLGLSPPPVRKPGPLEWAAVVLLPLFWPLGVILLWSSNVWTWRDKLIGTLIPPGGLWVVLYVLTFALEMPVQGCSSGSVNGHPLPLSCTGGPAEWQVILGALGLVLLVLSPFVSAIYLGRRLQRFSATETTGTVVVQP